jgi:hypothetical protein
MSPSDETSELEQLLVTFCSLLGPYDADDWSNIQHTFHLRKNRRGPLSRFLSCSVHCGAGRAGPGGWRALRTTAKTSHNGGHTRRPDRAAPGVTRPCAGDMRFRSTELPELFSSRNWGTHTHRTHTGHTAGTRIFVLLMRRTSNSKSRKFIASQPRVFVCCSEVEVEWLKHNLGRCIRGRATYLFFREWRATYRAARLP